jgi:putative DNA primase/helicase
VSTAQRQVNFDAIPFELRAQASWVLWKYGLQRPDGKRAKIPLMPIGNAAKVNDSATWSDFETVKRAFLNPIAHPGAFDGIGFVFAGEGGLVGIDVDNCISDDGTIAPWAASIMAGLSTYFESSPSGRGLHGILAGALPAAYGDGAKRTLAGGGGIEVYQNRRFFTVTGAHVPGTPTTIESSQRQLEAFLARELPRYSTGGGTMNEHPFFGAPRQSYRLGDYARHQPVDDGEDGAIIRRLTDKLGASFRVLFHDGNVDAYGGDESKADFAMLCDVARECGPDSALLDRLYRMSALYRRPGRAEKWQTKHSADGRTYGQMTIAKVIAAVSDSAQVPGASSWKIELARTIVERGVPPLLWDVYELLTADDGPALFFAPPGHLKSWLALHLCICIGTGAPFLGQFAVRRRAYVVYINLDSGANAFSRRLERVNVPDNLLIVNAAQYDSTEFENVFRTYPGAFVVVDCLADMGGGLPSRGEDLAQAARKHFRYLRALYERYGSNGVVLDHPHRPKEGSFDYYGSSQKEAALRTMWRASLIDDGEGSRSVKIECRKQSEAERFRPFVAAVDFRTPLVRFEFRGYLNEVTQQRQEGQSDVERVASVLHGVPGGLTCKQIMELSGLARDPVRYAVKDKRFRSTGGGRATRYTFVESSEAPGDSPFDSDIGSAESNGSS